MELYCNPRCYNNCVKFPSSVDRQFVKVMNPKLHLYQEMCLIATCVPLVWYHISVPELALSTAFEMHQVAVTQFSVSSPSQFRMRYESVAGVDAEPEHYSHHLFGSH